MHKDDLEKMIVRMFSTAEMHDYEVQKQLAIRGFRPNIGYLYRVLAEMETEGYLEGTRMKSALGPERKVYRLGKKGTERLGQELKEAVRTIHVRYMQIWRNFLLRRVPFENCNVCSMRKWAEATQSWWLDPKYSMIG